MGVHQKDDVLFNVLFKFKVDQIDESRNFTLMCKNLTPAGLNLRQSGLPLVQAVRSSGAGGVVKGVTNWSQVGGSVVYFRDDLVPAVNTIVTDLQKHGACAAFVAVEPSVEVTIPVFVLDGAQFKEIAGMKKANATVDLTSSKESPLDLVPTGNYGWIEGSVEKSGSLKTKDRTSNHDMCVQRNSGVRFTVLMECTVDGIPQKNNDVSLNSNLTPESATRINLCRAIPLVKIMRKKGQRGKEVMGVHNRTQVKGSVAYHQGINVSDVDAIVTDLGKLGAYAAFVAVQPSAEVAIPVFVLSDAQFKDLLKLKAPTLRVTLTPSNGIPPGSMSMKIDNGVVASLEKKEDVIGTRAQRFNNVTIAINIKYSNFRSNKNGTMKFSRQVLLPANEHLTRFKHTDLLMERAVFKSGNLENEKSTLGGKALLFDEKNRNSIDIIAEEAARNGVCALFVALDPGESYRLPVLVLDNSQLEILKSCHFCAASLTPMRRQEYSKDKHEQSVSYAEVAQPGNQGKASPYRTSTRVNIGEYHGGEEKKGLWKTVTSFLNTEPKVRGNLRRILHNNCNWFPSSGNLDSFQEAIDLLAISEASDYPNREMDEIQKQVLCHMKSNNYKIDIVLLSYAITFFCKRPYQDTKNHWGSLVQGFNNLNVSADCTPLCRVLGDRVSDAYNPCAALLHFASIYLKGLKNGQCTYNKGDTENIILKLVWLEVFHCGMPFDWKKFVGFISPGSFLPISLSVSSLRTIVAPEQFYSLGLFVQPTASESCTFIETMHKEIMTKATEAQLTLIIVDPHTATTKTWVRKVCTESIGEETCHRFLECLRCLWFSNDNDRWKFELITSLVRSFSARNMLRLDIFCVGIEHPDRMLCREIIIDLLRLKLQDPSTLYHSSRSMTMVDFEGLMKSKICNILASRPLFTPMQTFVRANMNVSASMGKKIRLLSTVYTSLISVSDVEVGDITTFIITAFEEALDAPNESKQNFSAPEAAFQVAQKHEDVFISGPADAIAALVVKKYIKSTQLPKEPRCLLKLPLGHLREGTLSSRLATSLTTRLCEIFNDVESACSLHSDLCTELSTPLLGILDTILFAALQKWNPSGVLDIFRLSPSCLTLLSKDRTLRENPSIESKFGGFKHYFMNWNSSADITSLPLGDIDIVRSHYDLSKWEAIERLFGGRLVPVSSLNENICLFDTLMSSINTSFHLSSLKGGDNNSSYQSILDVLRQYDCGTDDTSGCTCILKACAMIVDNSVFSVKKSHSICSIQTLSADLDNFREQFDIHIQTAAYFLKADCKLFSNSIGLGTWRSIKVEDFLARIDCAHRTLQKVLTCEGDGVFASVHKTIECLSEPGGMSILNREDFNINVSLLLACPTLNVDETQRDLFSIMSSLDSVTKPLGAFVRCCKQMKFSFTSEDKNFIELETIAALLDSHDCNALEVLQYQDLARKLVNFFSSRIETIEKNVEHCVSTLDKLAACMAIFRTIADNSDVWTFVREMKWFGKDGLQQFYSEFNNTTNKLLFATYESNVLDSLEPTVCFLSHVGSLYEECDMNVFIQSLVHAFEYDLNSRTRRQDVYQIVQENISNIRGWFDNGVDDITAIFSRFDATWRTGEFAICDGSLCLFYKHNEDELRLLGTELDDFALQLGFVQHDNEEVSSQIMSFLDQLQLFHKIVASQLSFVNAGYVRNDLDQFRHRVNQDLEVAKEIFRESKRLVAKCEAWKATIRNKYPLSTLFWNGDLRSLYDAVVSVEKNYDEIIPALSILTPLRSLSSSSANTSNTIDTIQECMQVVRDDSFDKNESWIEIVSKFVKLFFDKVSVQYLKPMPKVRRTGVTLHFLDGCDEEKERLGLFVMAHVYRERLPLCFELLDGFISPSLEEVILFLDRVALFPDSTFMITNVQALPANLQETIVNFISSPKAASNIYNLHCVQYSETLLHSSPWIEDIMWNTESDHDCHENWKSLIVDDINIEDVKVVTSLSCGAGKSRLIKKRMGELQEVCNTLSICIHEGTTIDSLVRSMKNHQTHETCRNTVHFSFMLGLHQYDSNLMKSLNHFFNNLLLSRTVRSTASSETFIMGLSKWNIFVELPGIGAVRDLNLAAFTLLRRYIPVLALCSTVEIPSKEFIIDEKARRVCTYLRAYSDNTIDRKFMGNANKQLLFVIDDSGSMQVTLDDGRDPFEIAISNALNIFDDHVKVGDSFGTIIFSVGYRVGVPLDVVQDDAHKQQIRDRLANSELSAGAGTEMYTALNHALSELGRAGPIDELSWIICLTDGVSDKTGEEAFIHAIRDSSPQLHLMVVGVNVPPNYENHLRDLCSKFGMNTLGAFISSQANTDAMNSAFEQVAARIPVSETFVKLDGQLDDQGCWKLMKEYLPDSVHDDDMLSRTFWIEFLYRRVKVFDENDEFNYNESYDTLGSSLMSIMLHEAEKLLSMSHSTRWKDSNHEQLIYDFTDKFKPQFRLICTAPELMDKRSIDRFEALDLPGFFIPTTVELRKRDTLDRYLSQAIGVPLTIDETGTGRLACIDDNGFVLTLDFVMKLLNIHERVICRIPCVIEGETGVSKTALTKMYSILRNSSLCENSKLDTDIALNSIIEELMASNLIECTGQETPLKVLRHTLTNAADGNATKNTEICCKLHDLLLRSCESRSSVFQKVPDDLKEKVGHTEVLEFLNWFVKPSQEKLFFELNVDASYSELQVLAFFNEVMKSAQNVAGSGALIVVFLDEVNTSSCIGLFKEIIVDRSICGTKIEDNIVVVAACNPAGRRSLSSNTSRECDLGKHWASGHYQVRELPSTLSALKWQYGALNAEQEKEFILRRMEMMGSSIPKFIQAELTELVAQSQEAIRFLAADQIEKELQNHPQNGCKELQKEAVARARSAVSLRDIQRVFSLFCFFVSEFPLTAGIEDEHYYNSMYLTIAIVYYLQLDQESRNLFADMILLNAIATHDFLKIIDKKMTEIALETKIPEGIALTDGLKENIFMTLVCALSLTPLVIIGPPGSSKTLSVNIVDDNMNGEESPSLLYRKLSRLHTYHYQCSKTSTSDEVAKVFGMAIQRQNTVDTMKHKCLVFMDEAGLPEEEKESLKVLHYHLESHMSTKAKVGFVAITNSVLDAAKSNRCVSLLRQDPSEKEMLQIAHGVLFQGEQVVNGVEFSGQSLSMDAFAQSFCAAYKAVVLIDDFRTFFGLRDFIYFLKSIKQRSKHLGHIIEVTQEDVLRSLERNFNGICRHDFKRLVYIFIRHCSFQKVPGNLEDCLQMPLDVVSKALSASNTTKARYTLIIDESKDDSIMRILDNEGLLQISKQSLFKLSNLGENSESERASLVSGVKFAASQGSKVVLSQTDSVNESFYDLFNQHFRRVRNREGKEDLFANIAVGGISRRSLVSSKFRCVLHIKAEDLAQMPAPFLNRFEKYRLSFGSVLCSKLDESPFLKRVYAHARQQLDSFTDAVKLCGFVSGQTIESVFIDMLSKKEYAQKGKVRINNTNVSAKDNSLKSFSDHFIAFAAVHLRCDISTEDFDSMAKICLKFLPLSESEALSELLEKTGIMCVKEVFEECLGTKPPSNIASRLVEMLSEVTITRRTIFQLLELATPEEIFAKRNLLPFDIVSQYFQQQHFGIKPFLLSMQSRPLLRLEKFLIHTRSDIDLLRIPSFRPDNKDLDKVETVQNLVQEDVDSIIIEHLDLVKNESSLRSLLESWIETTRNTTFLLIVDMSSQTAGERVNFVRCCIDQLPTESQKRLLMVLHYPPSAFLSNSFYPAIFLGGWRHIYLNNTSRNGISNGLKHVIEKACIGVHDHNSHSSIHVQEITNEIMPDVMKSLASQDIFYLEQIPPSAGFHQKYKMLLSILDCSVNNCTIRSILSNKFCAVWTEKNLTTMLRRASWSLKKGTSQLGLTRCLQSIMQDTMKFFFLDYLLRLNEWRNFDLLLDSSGLCHPVESLLFVILDQIPSLPFDELVLHQVDPTRKLRELPFSLTLDVKFPFFSLINKLLDEIVDCALMKYVSDEDDVVSLEVKDILEHSMVLLRENSVDQMYSGIILKTVEIVLAQEVQEQENSLFLIYLDQFLTWKLCCAPNSLASKWFIDKLNFDEAVIGSSSHKNLLTIHIAAKKYEMSLIRLSSMHEGAFWSDLTNELDQTNTPKSDLPLPGLEVVRLLCSWFVSHLSQLTNENAQAWMDKYSIFHRTLSDIIGDQRVTCGRTCETMRLMIFFYVLKNNTTQDATCIDCIKEFTNEEQLRSDIDTSVASLVKLIMVSNEDINTKHVCTKSLIMTLFSPQMLSHVDLHWELDLHFVLTDRKLLDACNRNDIVTLLRNACIYGSLEDKKDTNTKSLSPSRLAVINSHLSCQDLCTFTTDGHRLNIPRFIPAFATSDDDNITDREDNIISQMEPTSNIEKFFSNNTDSFSSTRAIAEATFQIMLEDTLKECTGKSSEQILLMFLKNLEMENNLTRQEQTRLRRIQTDASSTNAGSPIGIMILEACLICYLFKVSHEFAKERAVSALEGVYAEYAWSVLNCAMSARGSRLQEIFMLNIVRLGGQSKLRDLVRQGGSLFGLEWTREWSGGLPEARGDIDDVVNKAEAELHDKLQEEQRKAREMRLCPHCAEPFQIFARNCGQFVCGRADTHTTPMNGGGLGCGEPFADSEAGYYIQDDALLAHLQETVMNAREQAHTHDKMSMVWEELDRADLPLLSSNLEGDSSDSYHPVSITLEAIGNESNTNTIRHLVYSQEKINSFLMLPDMIEFYLWIHSTFKFIISPEQATSKTFGDIMKQDVLLKRFDQTHTNHVINLYRRVKNGLDSHLRLCKYEVNWDCETLSIPIKDLDDTSLIMLLSAYDHPTDGYDYLFIIMNQIILQYNEFILKLHDHKNKTVSPQMLLHRSPAGLVLKSLAFLISSEFPLMVESHREIGKNEYNFKRLEKEVMKKLYACNFCIKSPLKYLRAKFQFRTKMDSEVSEIQALTGIKSSSGVYFVHRQDLQLLESCLQIADHSNVNISHEMESTFVSKFHGLEYEDLRRILGGLRNILQTSQSTDWKVLQDLLPSSSEDVNDEMEAFGFPSLSSSQLCLTCISSLRPNHIFELIRFIGYQLATESYSFATLPLSMKSTIPIATKEEFRKNLSSLVDTQGYEQTIKLLNEFKNDILSFYQSFIRDHCSRSNSNDKLKSFLQDNNLCDNSDPIFDAIPNEISLRNFVSLCQDIHQLILFFISKGCEYNFVEDEAVDAHSPYTSPKRGSCWLFLSREDIDGKDTSNIKDPNEEKSVESNDVSEHKGLWFGSADFSERDISKNGADVFLHPHSTLEDRGDGDRESLSVSSIASFTVLADDTNNPAEDERMNYSANIIQIWWRFIKLKELETVESSNVENQDTIRGASEANQPTLSFTDTNLDDQQVVEKESRYKTLLGISSMSSVRLFWIFIAAHLMFKVVESFLS